MNCQSFENNVVEIVRRQPMEVGVLEQSLLHAESCSKCAVQLEAQRELSVGLRGLSNHMKAVQTADRVQKQLLEVLRERKFQPQQLERTSHWRVGAAAIAALLLIVFGIIALRVSQTDIPPAPIQAINLKPLDPVADNKRPAAAVEVTPVTASRMSVTPVKNLNRPSRVKRRLRFSVSSLIAANPPLAPEITTPFMPLGDVSLGNLQDGAQVVRVEMPRYAMARFGFPVNMERYDETVKADVWLGVDGLARAIRFVQ